MSAELEIILTEFREDKDKIRLDPALTSFKKYFPEARYVLYTNHDEDWQVDDVRVMSINDFGTRSVYNTVSYCKAQGLIDAQGDIAIAVDTDMCVVSENIRTIIPLTKAFKFCVTLNPRALVKVDGEVGLDGETRFNETKGYGTALNAGFLTMDTSYNKAKEMLKDWQDRLGGVRAQQLLWRSIYEHRVTPYILAPQWGVCREDVGIGNEVILHTGHKKVREYYGRT